MTRKQIHLLHPSSIARGRRVNGFSLLEMMIAVTLGLLLSAGIVTLFTGTSKTNRVQDALARVQENGRYAVTRMNADLRMIAGQYCSNFAGTSKATGNGPQSALRAPWVYTSPLALPDMTAPFTGTKAYPLSPRAFVQGYECSSGTCSPSVPTGIPAVGATANKRLKGTDVLTVRYQTGTGWPMTASSTCASSSSVTITPQDGDDHTQPAASNPITTVAARSFNAADLILISDCQNPSILPLASVSGNVLTLGSSVLPDPAGVGPVCGAGANRDTRVFNFTQGFITATYFIKLVPDPNPEATAGRMIPTLIRRINGQDEELVQGVERLDFLYGIQDNANAVHYLTAKDVDSYATGSCPPPPAGITPEAGCMWRSVKSVEVHMLMDTVNNIDVAGPDTAYRYSVDGPSLAPPLGANSAVTGLPYGSMIRREFISTATMRNYNP